jgi:hypothetical protein
MLADHLLGMLTDTSQVAGVAHAVLNLVVPGAPVEEMADDQVQDVREVKEMSEAVVEEIVSPRTEDQKRLKRNSMLKWRTIGEAKTMPMKVLQSQPQPLKGMMWI